MITSFNPTEKYQSQIPAVQLLVNLGFEPLSQKQVEQLRSRKQDQVLLEDILEERLLKLNQFIVKNQTHLFDLADAQEAIRQLKPSPEKIKGLRGTNEAIYDLLMLGTTIRKTINGDSKSHSFRYIDWENPKNNRYHFAPEFSVSRLGGKKSKRCDIVCFVNGIPFIVIENKSPHTSLKKAESQLIEYQTEENIPHLFYYAQLLFSMNRAGGKYATVGSSMGYWLTWQDEKTEEGVLFDLINRPINNEQKSNIFSGHFKEALPYFEEMALAGNRLVTEQDKLIYALCRPERLLDMVRRFTVFDGGIRKIARHQQYFSILKTLASVKHFDIEQRRKGGVVWHTQGSGKSLTMVMLAKALTLEPSIKNPRVIIATDRDDLDKQIKATFKACDLSPVRATSGANLLRLIENRTPIITTIINKFENAFRLHQKIEDDLNLFVLVDESHRTQSGKYRGLGKFALKMRTLLKHACYIGFTGTPLLKREKNTLKLFGGLIDAYTLPDAIRDGAVIPLLYEGRLVEQKVSSTALDQWFDKISQGLTDEQKADLKKKFSRLSQINATSQTLQAKAFDISEHYRQFWKNTGFKAQVVAPSKAAAIRMKELFDEIGHVTSEVIISAPTEHEGQKEVDAESQDKVFRFWKRMMDRYGNKNDYESQIVERFKSADDPEILIVVNKLLTGFDAPRNTVLYLCRPLKEHNLLQAIARVNRVFENKEFGFIVDYEGLLGELDQALSIYSGLEGYAGEDLENSLFNVKAEIEKLPFFHEQLWDVFKTLPNKKDMESFEQYLANESEREIFYEHLKAFGRCLHLSMSSEKIYDVYNQQQIDHFFDDLKKFILLKQRVQVRYQEKIDIKDYEPKIQKLLDQHVSAELAKTIIEPVNINDPDALQRVVEEQGISQASKADRIISATKRTISINMEIDPAFYKRFSELLEQTIADYRARRLSEIDYLNQALSIAKKIAQKEHGIPLPLAIKGNEDAIAFFGILKPILHPLKSSVQDDEIAAIALDVLQILKKHYVINLWDNSLVQNNILNTLDDYFIDTVEKRNGFQPLENYLNQLDENIIKLAKARFPE